MLALKVSHERVRLFYRDFGAVLFAELSNHLVDLAGRRVFPELT